MGVSNFRGSVQMRPLVQEEKAYIGFQSLMHRINGVRNPLMIEDGKTVWCLSLSLLHPKLKLAQGTADSYSTAYRKYVTLLPSPCVISHESRHDRHSYLWDCTQG